MGSCSCQVSAVIEINKKEEENSITSKKLLSSSIKKLDIESMIEEQKKEYPDMEEWKGDKYKGIGIKRMKGYKCDLPIDKLNKIEEKIEEKKDVDWEEQASDDEEELENDKEKENSENKENKPKREKIKKMKGKNQIKEEEGNQSFI